MTKSSSSHFVWYHVLNSLVTGIFLYSLGYFAGSQGVTNVEPNTAATKKEPAPQDQPNALWWTIGVPNIAYEANGQKFLLIYDGVYRFDEPYVVEQVFGIDVESIALGVAIGGTDYPFDRFEIDITRQPVLGKYFPVVRHRDKEFKGFVFYDEETGGWQQITAEPGVLKAGSLPRDRQWQEDPNGYLYIYLDRQDGEARFNPKTRQLKVTLSSSHPEKF